MDAEASPHGGVHGGLKGSIPASELEAFTTKCAQDRHLFVSSVNAENSLNLTITKRHLVGT